MWRNGKVVSIDLLCDLLHGEGKRITPQRRLIYQALINKANHPKAEDIYEEVRAIIPDISLSTVYKALRDLLDMGELLEIKYLGEQSRFDLIVTPHSHLICTGCSSIENVTQPWHIPEPDISEKGEFNIQKSEIIYWGLCVACQA
jgi:Fe2+ or Zn2+ uptake regulation protein